MSTEQLYDGRGGRLDLLVRAGADMPTATLSFSNDDGTVLDLTGSTVVARGTSRDDAAVRVALSTAAVGDPALGVVALDLDAAEIARLVAPGSASSKPRASGDWVMEQVEPGGAVVPLLYGEILVAGSA